MASSWLASRSNWKLVLCRRRSGLVDGSLAVATNRAAADGGLVAVVLIAAALEAVVAQRVERIVAAARGGSIHGTAASAAAVLGAARLAVPAGRRRAAGADAAVRDAMRRWPASRAASTPLGKILQALLGLPLTLTPRRLRLASHAGNHPRTNTPRHAHTAGCVCVWQHKGGGTHEHGASTQHMAMEGALPQLSATATVVQYISRGSPK